ncbi:MAG: NTP transferase domain-containing protein [Deltaproteobacteria bacterium]|jgi:bifunctional UDP-N-acetylglucosamine pyrophosphorylase/glucosamine-1-phosphate N-acetyltransferase|nr:NTP transferase domain-containing protein [Deltaproteobacteria bacterium]
MDIEGLSVEPRSEDRPAAVVLAAGMGKRMKSATPKVLHRVMGRTLLAYVLNAVQYLSPARILVVVGHGAEEVETALGRPPGVEYVVQTEQLGTGHAVWSARPALEGWRGPVVILPGDAPLVSPQTMLDFLAAHRALGAPLSVLTAELDDPASYGRVVRDRAGWLERIVEFRDADEDTRAIREVNAGVYAAEPGALFGALEAVRPANVQSEYYLTDVVGILRSRGDLVSAVTGPDPREIQGVNDRADLARCQETLKLRINEAWLRAGVTFHDPYSTYVEPSVRLERDCVLGPGVVLSGRTRVGEGACIGPYAVLADVEVGPGARVAPHAVLSGVAVPAGADARTAPPPYAGYPARTRAASPLAQAGGGRLRAAPPRRRIV